MALALTIDTLDVCNNSDYITEFFDPGGAIREGDEVSNYAAAYNRIVNKRKNAFVECHAIIRVIGSSLGDLDTNLDALALKMDAVDFTLAYNDGANAFSYTVAWCQPLYWNPADTTYILKFRNVVDCVMYRRP